MIAGKGGKKRRKGGSLAAICWEKRGGYFLSLFSGSLPTRKKKEGKREGKPLLFFLPLASIPSKNEKKEGKKAHCRVLRDKVYGGRGEKKKESRAVHEPH